jgi:hypothetical protein
MIFPRNNVTKKLLFCKYKPQEFEQISSLLCSVFDSDEKKLSKVYQDIKSTFHQPDWPLHFVERDFFHSLDKTFQSTYLQSPVIAVDLPSLFELDDGQDNKPTIAIIGQDSKSNNDYDQLVIGTPYGLHHRGSREKLPNTRLYFEMVLCLLKFGFRVYLTDLLKIWVCNPERRYVGIRLPNVDRQRFIQLIKPELAVIKPVAVLTWGKVSGNAVEQLKLEVKHVNLPHPSGAANGAWKNLIGKCPTDLNKLMYWEMVVAREFGNKANGNKCTAS